jgi:hypothetical protein
MAIPPNDRFRGTNDPPHAGGPHARFSQYNIADHGTELRLRVERELAASEQIDQNGEKTPKFGFAEVDHDSRLRRETHARMAGQSPEPTQGPIATQKHIGCGLRKCFAAATPGNEKIHIDAV